MKVLTLLSLSQPPAKRSKVYEVNSSHFFDILKGLLHHSTTRATTLLAIERNQQFVNILTNQTARDACLRSLHRAIYLLCFDCIQSNRLMALSLIEDGIQQKGQIKTAIHRSNHFTCGSPSKR